MKIMTNGNKWILTIVTIGFLAIIVRFWGPLSIPVLGIMMITTGYILLREIDKSYKLLGKIILFTGISIIVVSIVSASLLISPGKVGTTTQVVDIPSPTQTIVNSVPARD